jgi:hypothetical protein
MGYQLKYTEAAVKKKLAAFLFFNFVTHTHR